jgi:cell division protein FtsW (lipid II flippase)
LSSGILIGILVLGQRYRGAVFVAGQVNPAEVVKLLLAIFLAGIMTDFRKPLQQTVAGIPAPPVRSLITLVVLWGIPMALLVAQRDLGMIILLNIVLLVLVFMATGKWGYLVIGSGVAALASYVGFQLFSHARVRFLAWQDPFADATGKGWQILQSLSAMFSGGLWGSGLGSGAPTVVPIAASDFIYAAYAEELGFLGCVLLIIIYLILFYRGYRVADQVRQPFAQTLAAALTTMLAIQTLMNIGGVTKAIPLTGITLPLISHGGSSLVTSMIMLGLLTALSEPAAKK